MPAALELTRAMRCGRYLRAWSLTMLLVGVWHGAAPAAPAAPDQASVLILLPDQPGLPAAMAIVSGIRAVLLKEWSFRVTIEIEHVDVARFASPEAEERRLRTVYGSKYGHQRFDVIVAALPGPSRFIRRARDELWPGTPVVVCGVDERSVRDLKPPPGFAVLTIRFDMKGTVRAALSLLPDTLHVALVGGASQPEQVYHDLIRQAVSDVGGLDVIDLTNLSIADMLARVSNLPEHTISCNPAIRSMAPGGASTVSISSRTSRTRRTVPSSRRWTWRWDVESWAGRSSISRTSAAMPALWRPG